MKGQVVIRIRVSSEKKSKRQEVLEISIKLNVVCEWCVCIESRNRAWGERTKESSRADESDWLALQS